MTDGVLRRTCVQLDEQAVQLGARLFDLSPGPVYTTRSYAFTISVGHDFQYSLPRRSIVEHLYRHLAHLAAGSTTAIVYCHFRELNAVCLPRGVHCHTFIEHFTERAIPKIVYLIRCGNRQ